MIGPGASDLAAVRAAWLADHPAPVSGAALASYRAGPAAPVGVATRALTSTPAPHSLDVILYDPEAPEPSFLLVLALTGVYIGPGEYKGGADDVMVGLGVAADDGSASTWTAAKATASDFVAYDSGARATVGTLTSTGLVTGPVFGPPTGDQPACAVLFAWFELGGA